jgi:hypothetical protein
MRQMEITMNVINRKSKELTLHGGRAKTRLYVSVSDRYVYFTSAVSKVCELGAGLYVHFINDGSEWSFYVDDDSDGFKLNSMAKSNAYFISNSGLCHMILKSLGVKTEKRLMVEATKIIHDKCPVFKLSNENVFS